MPDTIYYNKLNCLKYNKNWLNLKCNKKLKIEACLLLIFILLNDAIYLTNSILPESYDALSIV